VCRNARRCSLRVAVAIRGSARAFERRAFRFAVALAARETPARAVAFTFAGSSDVAVAVARAVTVRRDGREPLRGRLAL
jgi:hypothetical protein